MANVMYVPEEGVHITNKYFGNHEYFVADNTQAALELLEKRASSLDAIILGMVIYQTPDHMFYPLSEGTKVYDQIDKMGLLGKVPLLLLSTQGVRMTSDCNNPRDYIFDSQGRRIVENPAKKIYVGMVPVPRDEIADWLTVHTEQRSS